MDYTEALDEEGWSNHYNMDNLNTVISSIQSGNVSVWSEELVKICSLRQEEDIALRSAEVQGQAPCGSPRTG